MAGLTAPPDNAAPPAGQVIEADGWFPGINTDDVRRRIRVGEGAVTPERLAEAVVAGILSGMKALSAWRSLHAAAGVEALADITQARVAGENMAEVLWRRIVIYYAAADLADTHTDVSATDDALDREEGKRQSADLYRRKAYEAVADLRALGDLADPAGEGRNQVELI